MCAVRCYEPNNMCVMVCVCVSTGGPTLPIDRATEGGDTDTQDQWGVSRWMGRTDLLVRTPGHRVRTSTSPTLSVPTNPRLEPSRQRDLLPIGHKEKSITRLARPDAQWALGRSRTQRGT